MASYQDATIVVTVEAYPQVSSRRETVCVAGVRVDGGRQEWIRIWPYPLRDLPPAKRFRTWDLVELPVVTSAPEDTRPESHRCDPDRLAISRRLPAGDWADRRRIIDPLLVPSMCEFLRLAKADRRSLGAVQVGAVQDFEHEPVPAAELEERRRTVERQRAQGSLLAEDKAALEPLPYRFRYIWSCSGESACAGHRYPIITFEIGTTFRNYRREYGTVGGALDKMREAFLGKCNDDRDLAFFVGNMKRFPDNWLTLGIYNPPRASGAFAQGQLLGLDQ